MKRNEFRLENKRSFPNQLMQLSFFKAPNHSLSLSARPDREDTKRISLLVMEILQEESERVWSVFGFPENSERKAKGKRKEK